MTKTIDIYLLIIKYVSSSATTGETSECPAADSKNTLRYGTMEQTKQGPPAGPPEPLSQRFTALNTKSDSRVDTSCQQSTHNRGGKPPNKATGPASDQTHHRDGSTRADSLPVCLVPKEGRSGLRKGRGFSSPGRASRGRWTEQAYLWTARCAWADPACRSFCHSHNFFSLSRGERREGNVSVKPLKNNKTQDLQNSWVRPMLLLQTPTAPALNL